MLEAISARNDLTEANFLRFLLRLVIFFKYAHHSRASARVNCAAPVGFKIFERRIVVNLKQHAELLEICD